jgi:hypothetical protein
MTTALGKPRPVESSQGDACRTRTAMRLRTVKSVIWAGNPCCNRSAATRALRSASTTTGFGLTLPDRSHPIPGAYTEITGPKTQLKCNMGNLQ